MKKRLFIGTLATAVILGGAYSAGVGFYAEKFQANTKFGSLDISNMTLVEAEAKIADELNKKEVVITENGKELGRFTLEQAGVQVNATKELEKAYNTQDPVQWATSFFNTTEYQDVLLNNVIFNDVALTETLDSFGLNNANRTAAVDAKIEYSNGQGYHVVPEKLGNQLDLEKVKATIVSQVQQGQTNVDISGDYLAPKVTQNDETITKVMSEINKIADAKISLNVASEKVTIPKEKIMEWMYFDGNNDITFDQEKVIEYVKSLNEQYATYDKVRHFHSTLQGDVEVQPGTLGWSIDSELESAQIMEDLKQGASVSRDVNVVGSGYGQGTNDIGNSYVEVDVANQMMFIYKNGEQVLSTPIVTGHPGTNTVVGAYSAWDKQQNATLTGFNPRRNANYEQPVDYWIPFDATGQGIHDANWQASFGGDAYLTSGSLGCINTPPGVMGQVYELVDLGMPVIVY